MGREGEGGQGGREGEGERERERGREGERERGREREGRHTNSGVCVTMTVGEVKLIGVMFKQGSPYVLVWFCLVLFGLGEH